MKDLKQGYLVIGQKKKETTQDSQEDKIKFYKELPDDLKKLFASGQDMILISEKEITHHKTAIMRDDIVERIEETEIIKEKITVETKKL